MANRNTGYFIINEALKQALTIIKPLTCTQTRTISYRVCKKISFRSANKACVIIFTVSSNPACVSDIVPHYSAEHVGTHMDMISAMQLFVVVRRQKRVSCFYPKKSNSGIKLVR